jgi:CubicO group peptidase (beta-lactamase class C family)
MNQTQKRSQLLLNLVIFIGHSYKVLMLENHDRNRKRSEQVLNGIVFGKSISSTCLLLLVLLFCLHSCSDETDTIPESNPEEYRTDTIPVWSYDVYPDKFWSYANPLKYGYDSRAKETISNFIKRRTNTTGLVVVVGGEIIYSYGNISELSYLASCRKSLLAIIYGKYVESNSIDLDRTVEELGFDDVGGLLPIEKTATVLNLITARSGVYHLGSNLGDDRAFAPERGTKIPGEYFLYNNWDFNAAGAAFETMTGLNIYDSFQADIAEPLRMQDFNRAAQVKSGDMSISVFPAYHFWLSTRDMARVGYLMLREGSWGGRQIVPSEWVKRIVSVVTPVEEMNPESRRSGPFGYGYMWWIWDGQASTGAFKGGFTAQGAYGQFITVLPALDMVIAHKTSDGDTSDTDYFVLVNTIVNAQIIKHYLNE